MKCRLRRGTRSYATHHKAIPFIIGVAFTVLTLGSGAFAQVELTDIKGRRLDLPAPAKRIILAMSGDYQALALLNQDAADLVVGVGLAQSGAGSEASRDLDGKARLGNIWTRTFSIEKALELKPDLLIAPIFGGGVPEEIEFALAKADIPIVYLDFRTDPARNTAPSIEILGKIIGAEEKAAEFTDFYRRRVSRITDRLEARKPARLKLLMTSHMPGEACCFSTANGGVTAYFGGLGVNNIAEGKAPTSLVQLSLEYIVESDPDIYVVSGPHSPFGQPPSLEQGVSTLEKLRLEPGLRDLSAMRNRRVHAIDFSLTTSALNVLALEVLAKWIHPKLFADVDPQATLDEINRRFLKQPLKRPLWVSLDTLPINHPISADDG